MTSGLKRQDSAGCSFRIKIVSSGARELESELEEDGKHAKESRSRRIPSQRMASASPEASEARGVPPLRTPNEGSRRLWTGP